MRRIEKQARSYLRQFRDSPFPEGAAHCAAMVVICCLQGGFALEKIRASITELRRRIHDLIAKEILDALEKGVETPEEHRHLNERFFQGGPEVAKTLGIAWNDFGDIYRQLMRKRIDELMESDDTNACRNAYRIAFLVGIGIPEVS